jgi:hypothetical protein
VVLVAEVSMLWGAIGQAVSASQELEKSEGASFEIEEDELDEDDDFEIEVRRGFG